MTDYLEWCARVLGVYLGEARNSLEARRDGLRPEQVARRVFGTGIVGQEGFDGSVRWEALKQAIRDLDDEGFIFTDDDKFGDKQTTPGKIANDGEAFLEEKEARWGHWWAICAQAPKFKPEHRGLIELVNRLSPREDGLYAWMEWVHQDALCRELGWQPELLRLVVQEIRHQHDYILPRPNFYPFDPVPSDDMYLRATYMGVVLTTKRHLTVEARQIDKLVEEWETTSVDFKRELVTKTKDQKAEFVKDVLALANTQVSGERWLIVGFDDKTRTHHSAPDPSLSQDHLEQILAEYTDPFVSVRYDVVEHHQGLVGRVRVLRDPAKLPYKVARSVGDRKRIEKGQIFVRHGSQTEEPTLGELKALQLEGERARPK